MEDRRGIKRRHLIYYLRVFDRKTMQVIGHLVDITAAGLMLIIESAIQPNVTFDLRLDLPRDILAKVHLDFRAQSLWSKPDVNPDFYVTGFKFLNVEPGDVEVISHLIDEFGFRD